MSMLKIGMESKECTYYFTLLMSTFDVYFNLRAKKKKVPNPTENDLEERNVREYSTIFSPHIKTFDTWFLGYL